MSIITSPNWIGQTDPGIVIKAGYEFSIEVPQPTTVVLLLGIHPSREHTLLKYDVIETFPEAPGDHFLDTTATAARGSGSSPAPRCSARSDSSRIAACRTSSSTAPASTASMNCRPRSCLSCMAAGMRNRSAVAGCLEPVRLDDAGFQPGADDLRLGERQCRVRLSTRPQHPTALETFQERRGVCRDFAHLSIAMCRAMNIPARYVNGYLGDIAIEPNPSPMDFNAWFEAYLDGSWHLFDARHNQPRVGRIPIAKGKDAADVAMITTFGPHILKSFEVWTEQVA